MADWRNIYSRELREMPPVDEWAAAYFGYQGPSEEADTAAEEGEIEEWQCPFPDETE